MDLGNLLNDIKAFLGGQHPQSPTYQAQQQIASPIPPAQQVQPEQPQAQVSPIIQALAPVQQYIQDTKGEVVPTFKDAQIQQMSAVSQPPASNSVMQNGGRELSNIASQFPNLGKAAWNFIASIPNTILGKGLIGPAYDIGQVARNTVEGQQTSYNDLLSPASKFGANIGATINPDQSTITDIKNTPQEAIANAAGAVEPIVAAGGVSSVGAVGGEALADQAEKGVLDYALQGAKQGAIQGGIYGGLSGLEQGRNAPAFQDQAIQGLFSAGAGAVAGGVLGGLTGGGAAALSKTAKGMLQQNVENEVTNWTDKTAQDNNVVNIRPAFSALDGKDADMIKSATDALDEDPQNPGAATDIQNLTKKYLPEFNTLDYRQQAHIWDNIIQLKEDPNSLLSNPESINPAIKDTVNFAFSGAKKAMQSGFVKVPGVEDTNNVDQQPYEQALMQKFQQVGLEGLDPEEKDYLLNFMSNNNAPTELTPGSLKGQNPVDDQFEAMKSAGDNNRFTDNGKLTPEQAQNLSGEGIPTQVTPPGQDEPGGVAALDPKDVAKQARAARFGAMQQLNFRASIIANEERAVLGNDPVENELYRQALEHPEGADWLAEQSKNPEAFLNLIKQKQDFYDYVLQSAKDNKVNMGTIEDYYTHMVDLPDEETKQKFNDFMAANAKNFNSPFTKDRYFMTLDELRNAGFDIKDQPSYMDTMQYAQSMGKQIGANALNNKINELRPNGAVPIAENGTVPYNYQGRLFLQSNVPGNQGTFIDPEIQQHMNFYNQSAFADNPWVQTLDKFNTGLKEIKLSGGLFHALRETLNYVGSTGDVQDLPTATRMFIDPQFANDQFQQLVDSGAVADASNMGIRLSDTSGIGGENNDILQLLNSKDPIKKATFQRLINYYILKTVDNLPDDQKTPEMGAQIQALYNGLNNEIAGTNKTTSQIARFGLLAPQFNLGKLINVVTAIKGGNTPEAWFARRAILGTAIGTAIQYEILNTVLNHKLDINPASIFANGMVHPSVSLPYQSPNGKPLAMDLPGSDFSDLSKIFTTPGGITHALTSRTSALGSLWNQIATGTDYYGNPTNWQTLVSGQLPIPAVQILRTLETNPKTVQKDAQGTPVPGTGVPYQDWRTAALNTAGFRVHNDQNNPVVAAQTKYFNDIAQVSKGLNKTEQGIWNGVIFPVKTDANGNPMIDKSPEQKPEYYSALLANSDLLKKAQAIELAQPQHDPMWDLNPNQLHTFLLYEQLHTANPTTGLSNADPTTKALAQALPQGFFQQRADYFNTLQQQGAFANQPPSNTIQTPKAISDFWTYYSSLPYGSGDRKAALASPIGQAALAFMQLQGNQTNQQRADMGLPILPTSGGSSGGYGYSSGSGYSSSTGRVRGTRSAPRGLNPYYGLKGISRYATMRIARPKIAKEKGLAVNNKNIKLGNKGVSMSLNPMRTLNRYPKLSLAQSVKQANVKPIKIKPIKIASAALPQKKFKLMKYNPQIGLHGSTHL